MPTSLVGQQIWESGDLAKCEVIAGAIPIAQWPRVAAEIVELCLPYVRALPEVEEVARIGRSESRWTEGHAIFDAVRARTLTLERQTVSIQDPTYILLMVAENAAKVIFNATNTEMQFDSDSGAWLLKTLAQFVDRIGDAALRDSLRSCLLQ